jgi:putative NADH-flavin reductase
VGPRQSGRSGRIAGQQFRSGNQNWVHLNSPANLEPDTRTGSYRRGTTLPTEPDGVSQIVAEALAVAALDEIEHPSPDQQFTVARNLTATGST